MNCDAVGSLFKLALCPQWTEITSGKFYDLFDLCEPGWSTSEANLGDSESTSAISFMNRPQKVWWHWLLCVFCQRQLHASAFFFPTMSHLLIKSWIQIFVLNWMFLKSSDFFWLCSCERKWSRYEKCFQGWTDCDGRKYELQLSCLWN